jgi:hypothetical protein
LAVPVKTPSNPEKRPQRSVSSQKDEKKVNPETKKTAQAVVKAKTSVSPSKVALKVAAAVKVKTSGRSVSMSPLKQSKTRVAKQSAGASAGVKKAKTSVGKTGGSNDVAKKGAEKSRSRSKSPVKAASLKTREKASGSKLKRSATVPKAKLKSGMLAGTKRIAAKPATKLAPQSKKSGSKAATKKPKRK